MLKHTKIVATVSDQRCEVEFIDALYKAGMNVVRLNTAHMAEEGLTRVVNNVRTVSNRIGILMDTKIPILGYMIFPHFFEVFLEYIDAGSVPG